MKTNYEYDNWAVFAQYTAVIIGWYVPKLWHAILQIKINYVEEKREVGNSGWLLAEEDLSLNLLSCTRSKQATRRAL